MSDLLLPADQATDSLPVFCVSTNGLDAWLGAAPEAVRAWVAANSYKAEAGALLALPTDTGGLGGFLFGLGVQHDACPPFLLGKLATDLPEGTYRLEGEEVDGGRAALGFLLASYRFDRYRKGAPKTVRLVTPGYVDRDEVVRIARGVALARDLINIPANDLGPAELADAAIDLIVSYGGTASLVVGENLLAENLPLIHAVGKASTRRPRLIDLRWGNPENPRVTLVGKGVCFDTGGLDLKPGSAMALMKKDMGGAANALGLAQMIMDADLPVALRVLIPAVENSVAGNAFRPGDVLPSRKGISVEIGNTDAEGRLVLADALALADEEHPDLLIDLATLTGAARVALGPDLPPFYTDDDALADDVARAAVAVADPLWRMPLWKPYLKLMDSKIADINHISSGPFAGSITAALFLSKFVESARSWAHFDIYGWTPKAQPGRPEGGEGQAIRALYAVIKDRYKGR